MIHDVQQKCKICKVWNTFKWNWNIFQEKSWNLYSLQNYYKGRQNLANLIGHKIQPYIVTE